MLMKIENYVCEDENNSFCPARLWQSARMLESLATERWDHVVRQISSDICVISCYIVSYQHLLLGHVAYNYITSY